MHVYIISCDQAIQVLRAVVKLLSCTFYTVKIKTNQLINTGVGFSGGISGDTSGIGKYYSISKNISF